MRFGPLAFNSCILALCLAPATVLVAAAPQADNGFRSLVVPQSGPYRGVKFYAGSHALVIGISRYQHLSKEHWLAFASVDADEVRNELIRHYGFVPENVTLLTDEQATKANIEAALSALADGDNVKRDDRVLVYFAGHGQTVKLADGGEMGFLIPYDAKVDLRSPENRSGYLATCLRMDSIWGYLEACPARHRLLLADACFGGLLVKSRGLGEAPSPATVASLLARPAIQALTAGGRDEAVTEDPKLGHGAFTFKLLEELRARAAMPDSVFLVSDLAAKLKVSVANLTKARQTPQFGSYANTEGDFLFVTTSARETNRVAANRTTFTSLINEALKEEARNPNTYEYTQIADLQYQSGNLRGASESVDAAVRYLPNIKDMDERESALMRLAMTTAEHGDVGSTRRAMVVMKDGASQSKLHHMVTAQLRSGDIIGAKKTAGKITDVNLKPPVLGEIALSEAKAGQLVAARTTILEALASLAQFQSGIIVEPPGAVSNPYFIADILRAQVAVGDLAGAEELVKRLEPVVIAEGWSFVLDALVKRGDSEGALQRLEKIRMEDKTPYRLSLAQSFLDVNDLPRAKKVLEPVAATHRHNGRTTLNVVCFDLVRSFIKSDDLDLARNWAVNHGDGLDRALLLSLVIEAVASRGDSQAARNLFSSVPQGHEDWLIAALAHGEAEAGNVSNALKVAAGVKDVELQKAVFGNIALEQIIRGDLVSARASAARSEDDWISLLVRAAERVLEKSVQAKSSK